MRNRTNRDCVPCADPGSSGGAGGAGAGTGAGLTTRGIRLGNGAAALVLLTAEILIALYAHDAFIRPYGGDILVIPLLACLWRVVFPRLPRHIGLYMIGAGFLAEAWQAGGLVHALGLDGTVWAVILGTGFSHWDLVCYAVGGCAYEWISRGILRRRESHR